MVSLTAACLVNAVNAISTLASLKARHIFTPEGKWSPLSYMKLTHEVNGEMETSCSRGLLQDPQLLC